MVQRKCPQAKQNMCYDRGDCEDCSWNKLIQRYERKVAKLQKENDKLREQLKKSIPEKEAFWESQEEENDFLWTKCSNCGYETENYNAVKLGNSSTDYVDVKLPYCPECGCKMKVHKKEIKVGDFVETTVVHKSLSHNRMVSFGQLVRGWVTDIEDNSVRIELMQKYLNGCAIAARKTDVTFIDRRKKERKKTKLEEIVDSAVPKFNKDDYVEGIETVGVKGFDERTAFVRGWVNSVYGDYIDIQADDEYKGYRGTHIDFSTAKKIEPAKPRIVLL